MTSNFYTGTERPLPSRSAAPRRAGLAEELAHSGGLWDYNHPDAHSPEAEDLLRRYLAEIHSYRQLGNAALRELESRLAAIVSPRGSAEPRHARPAASAITQPSLQEAAKDDATGRSLRERLDELSTYLHADLSRQASAGFSAPPARGEESRRGQPATDRQSRPVHAGESSADDQPQRPSGSHKLTPMAPVLDRAWFEQRFETMRASINDLAEQIPTQRIDALEAQFRALMEKLDARETDRSVAAVEAGLKKLAAYLEDNKQWAVAQDARARGVEERLDHLSGLVAQSHAAISATAKGLEIVARGTGANLAHATADLVARKLEQHLEPLNPKEPMSQLSNEIAKLSVQSAQNTRGIDERLKQLQNDLDESFERLADTDARRPAPARSENWLSRLEREEFDDDFEGERGAAQRASGLAGGIGREFPQNGEPVRYQIPYGEFLPEEENSHSRTGLIIAVVILLLASAAMLFLNLRDKGSAKLTDARTPAVVERNVTSASIAPVATASTSAKTSERISHAAAPGIGISNDLWVTGVDGERISTQFSSARDVPGAHAAAETAPLEPKPARDGEEPLPASGVSGSESLRQAAVDGDATAQFTVARTYLDGGDIDDQLPVGERLSKAARWFRRAAENSHAPSQYRLATLYELGQGAPKNYAEAMVWYKRAAELGHIKAMHNLAVLSINGGSRTANYLTAAKWFTKAAEYGLKDSQYNLGILYERGLGVPRDLAKAYQWFSLAANQGDAKGEQKRREIAAKLSAADLTSANALVAAWNPRKADEAANGEAPEPPVEQSRVVQPAILPKTPDLQLSQSAWSPQIMLVNTTVADAQRLLTKLGFGPGPADGILGPKTAAAIRAFEMKQGLPATGRVTDTLVAKMASILS